MKLTSSDTKHDSKESDRVSDPRSDFRILLDHVYDKELEANLVDCLIEILPNEEWAQLERMWKRRLEFLEDSLAAGMDPEQIPRKKLFGIRIAIFMLNQISARVTKFVSGFAKTLDMDDVIEQVDQIESLKIQIGELEKQLDKRRDKELIAKILKWRDHDELTFGRIAIKAFGPIEGVTDKGEYARERRRRTDCVRQIYHRAKKRKMT